MKNPGIFVSFNPWSVNYNYSYFDKKSQRSNYEKYNKKYQDDGDCNIRYETNSSSNRMLRLFFIESIDRIDLVCDKDYDAQHPSGSSLNDCFTVFSVSPKKFIQSKYKDGYNWNNDQTSPSVIRNIMLENNWGKNLGRHAIHPVEKPLEDLVPGDLDLCCGNLDEFTNYLPMFIKIDSFPSTLGTYIFSLKITLSDGRVFKKNIHFDYSEPTSSKH